MAPALQAKGERGFGYDLFTKRDTSEPILEGMYAKETDKETRAKLKELKKTEPEKAAGLLKRIVLSYRPWTWNGLLCGGSYIGSRCSCVNGG